MKEAKKMRALVDEYYSISSIIKNLHSLIRTRAANGFDFVDIDYFRDYTSFSRKQSQYLARNPDFTKRICEILEDEEFAVFHYPNNPETFLLTIKW